MSIKSKIKATDVIGMDIQGVPIDISTDADGHQALFDTGTSFIALCQTALNRIGSLLAQAGCQKSSGTMICSCGQEDLAKYPNFTIYTRGLAINVLPKDYLLQVFLHNISLNSIERKILFGRTNEQSWKWNDDTR